MRFGLFYIVQSHPDWTEQRSLTEAVEQIELAERLGLDEVWLGEHHFSQHGLLSGIFSFTGCVAACTERMRIGTAIVVLPYAELAREWLDIGAQIVGRCCAADPVHIKAIVPVAKGRGVAA